MSKNISMKDVTEEFFGTKGKTVTPAGEKLESAAGFDSINTPLEPKKNNVVSVEATDRMRLLDGLVRDLTKNFVKIGFELYHINKKRLYKELGYKTFEEFAKVEFGFSKSSAYNFINVCVKYCARDDSGEPMKLLKREYQKFSSSQLITMLRMNEEIIQQIDPKKSVKEIQQMEKKHATPLEVESSNSDSDDSNISESSGKKEKKNVRDVSIPVMRFNMAKGQTWEEVITETTKKVCMTYLNDDKRKKDGRDYAIEVNIVYTDKSAM